jgi:hypothetical protein
MDCLISLIFPRYFFASILTKNTISLQIYHGFHAENLSALIDKSGVLKGRLNYIRFLLSVTLLGILVMIYHSRRVCGGKNLPLD